MAENEIVRLTRETMFPRSWSASAITLMFISTPPFIALWLHVSSSDATAGYAVLFLMAVTHFLLFAWSRGTSTGDMARRLILRSGWFLRDVPLQLVTGMLPVAGIVAFMWVIGAGRLNSPDLIGVALPLVAFFWFVSVPIETLLQAWVWPMAFPFGPVTAQVAFLFLHGARASDAGFAVFVLMAGTYFWLLSFLRYLNHSRPGVSRWFGPVAAWSAHATWNTLLIWVALSWPSLEVLDANPILGWSAVLLWIVGFATLSFVLWRVARRHCGKIAVGTRVASHSPSVVT